MTSLDWLVIGGYLVDRQVVALRDDQRMAFAQRPDVEEGEDVLVLVDPVAGDLAVEDLVEDGAHERNLSIGGRW